MYEVEVEGTVAQAQERARRAMAEARTTVASSALERKHVSHVSRMIESVLQPYSLRADDVHIRVVSEVSDDDEDTTTILSLVVDIQIDEAEVLAENEAALAETE